MWLIDQLAEAQILAAIERGELDDLPGAGKPLELEDDRMVPESLRAGYRLLKNAGYLPPELTLRREIADAEALLRLVPEPGVQRRTALRLSLLRARLPSLTPALEANYREPLASALEGRRKP